MVVIRTNRPEYRNDIAEEIMLFLGIVETALVTVEPGEEPECGAAIATPEQSGAQGVLPGASQSDDALIVTALLQYERAETGSRLYTLYASIDAAHTKRRFTIDDDAPLAVKKCEKRELKLAIFALMRARYPEIETPWGSLTGIRPTKLFREIARQSGEAEAERMFADTFSVSPEKTALARDICRVQRPYIESAGPKDIDVYIGIPFCKTRCLYCSFLSEVLRDDGALTAYLAALKEDILAGARLVDEFGWRVRAMYVGGGTPTVLTAPQLESLLQVAFAAYGGFGGECTVEAGRPDTIDRDKLAVLKRLGVGRISINPQSMNDETLRRIGRAHSVAETFAAFRLAREIGFDSINMDVIAGLPGETSADMRATYDAILPLAPENLTVHTLAVKRSSLLKKRLEEYPLPSAFDAAQMVLDGATLAESLHMQPYYMYRQKYMRGNLENVGYAMPGHVCIYNVDMMEETVSILSHGAGSMTKRVYDGGNRIERLPSPKDVNTYVAKLPVLIERKRRFFS